MNEIMGQKIEDLLIINDRSMEGRISFFVVICILLISMILYNLAIVIWSVKKTELLKQYKSELYKKFKQKKDVTTNAPSKHLTEEKIKDDNYTRLKEKATDKEIENAIENLERFRRKKHL